MTEIYTIALSSLGIALAQYCKGFADSTAYDEKAKQDWYEQVNSWSLVSVKKHLLFNPPQFTRYHIGTAWDAWHVMSRLSVIICYVTALSAGVCIGNSGALWILIGCNALAGIIGFNLGDRWRGSMWMRYLGRLINGEHI